jgi:hypothetical protein
MSILEKHFILINSIDSDPQFFIDNYNLPDLNHLEIMVENDETDIEAMNSNLLIILERYNHVIVERESEGILLTKDLKESNDPWIRSLSDSMDPILRNDTFMLGIDQLSKDYITDSMMGSLGDYMKKIFQNDNILSGLNQISKNIPPEEVIKLSIDQLLLNEKQCVDIEEEMKLLLNNEENQNGTDDILEDVLAK